MVVQIPGLVAIIIFYIIIAVAGMVVGKTKNKKGTTTELFIANRNLGWFVASITMAATNVGGGYIAGTAEAFGRDGLLWCIGPIGNNIGFCIAAILVVPKVRSAGYTTILDPMQIKYGDKMGALLIIPDLCGSILWEAAILAALGTTLSIILDLSMVYSIVVCWLHVLWWTDVRGVYRHYTNLFRFSWIDWNMTDFDGEVPLNYNQWAHIFPMVLHYVCPKAVSIVGIGAMAAAVMSSADSCILATGSVFTHNIYRKLIRTKASETELIWVLRVSMLSSAALGSYFAIAVQSVYGLFFLCADLMFVVQAPQLICALWIAGGEPFLQLPALIKYPWYDATSGQLFIFKTFSMVISLIVIIVVSFVSDHLFMVRRVDPTYDFLKGFKRQERFETRL